MKKMKGILSVLLSTVLIGGVTVGLTACGEDDWGIGDAQFQYNITVWVGDGTKDLTKDLIKKFNQENDMSIGIKATIQEVTEASASGDVMAKPASAPEIFCFAQDQIARLVAVDLLDKPIAPVEEKLREEHSASSIAAASMGDVLYAYPLTEDNGYFLYYDKDVVSDEQAKTIEGIVAACEANNKYFSFGLEGAGSAWYAASFFYATDGAGNQLCESEWTVDGKGRFTGYTDTFNSANGMIAAHGIQKVVNSSRFSKNGKASDFTAGTPAGAVVSGIWDYQTAKNAFESAGRLDKLGITKLPTFEDNGETYQLRSYLGCKLLGVTPQTDGLKAAALHHLARYLTNAQSQMARYEAYGWGPSAKLSAEQAATVQNDVVLKALMATATVNQGQYPTNWWPKAETLVGQIKNAESDGTIQIAMEAYSEGLNQLLTNVTA